MKLGSIFLEEKNDVGGVNIYSLIWAKEFDLTLNVGKALLRIDSMRVATNGITTDEADLPLYFALRTTKTLGFEFQFCRGN
jgi:hypothetical protein